MDSKNLQIKKLEEQLKFKDSECFNLQDEGKSLIKNINYISSEYDNNKLFQGDMINNLNSEVSDKNFRILELKNELTGKINIIKNLESNIINLENDTLKNNITIDIK